MTADDRPRAVSADRFTAKSGILARFFQAPWAGALVSILLVAIFLSLTQDVFLTWANLMNIVRSNSVVFILALGATYVVIAGAIDLSVASLMAVCTMVYGLVLTAGVPAIPALFAIMVLGALLGALNGWLISYARVV